MRAVRFLPILVPVLASLALSGCLWWLAVPELGYEGYEYNKGEGSLYTAMHPHNGGARATPTPDIE